MRKHLEIRCFALRPLLRESTEETGEIKVLLENKLFRENEEVKLNSALSEVR